MTKEEAKQYLRNQINSCIKTDDKFYKNWYVLCYNNSYLRALKLSKITGQPVNKEDFNGGETLFGFNSKYKTFWQYTVIGDYLRENYSTELTTLTIVITEVINEYEEYKGYSCG